MSEMELVELLGGNPILRSAITVVYKNSGLCPISAQRYSSVTPTSWATFYNLEIIIAFAFRLSTYEVSRIRQKVRESLTRRKGINLFFALKCKGNNKCNHIKKTISYEIVIGPVHLAKQIKAKLPNEFVSYHRKHNLKLPNLILFNYLCSG